MPGSSSESVVVAAATPATSTATASHSSLPITPCALMNYLCVLCPRLHASSTFNTITEDDYTRSECLHDFSATVSLVPIVGAAWPCVVRAGLAALYWLGLPRCGVAAARGVGGRRKERQHSTQQHTRSTEERARQPARAN
ncbi:hypothetical protein E2C01_070074 [Portunus trituberculatus]|uniref:Uncharacterized protein n=1 Tax=Portunus trituberculatus TaxID=210409 RepID=A0A5B7HRR4_PORTR|nr:hypothetical protein [Portunus trituberculatus]